MTTPNWPDATEVTLDDWGPSNNVIEGAPHLSGKVMHANPDGSSECGLWSCTPGKRRVTIPSDEFCYFVAGKGRYVADDGQEIPIAPGAMVFFPAGWTGLCIVTETATKAFMSR
ncbi:cupin domain-containing protein [Defluviimonas salinarum]|uniref:Cupin domain-containing protein n=1 Tax=Defluviimonas salinarum TaxID=2992147 RepID=A0ABT3J6W5_9RHOB|nr:cupin domain-containing protein [Defluviimonas salinarum]MCW3783405.1 cupin domain-containing protein [Defluviimonas salinarum]